MKLSYFVFLGMTLLMGCATGTRYTETVASWVGHTSDELVSKWGAPDQTLKLDSGQTVYTYLKEYGANAESIRNPAYLVGNKPLVSVSRQFCKTQFILDTQSKIQKWHWEGNSC